jgi:hypothetical protein
MNARDNHVTHYGGCHCGAVRFEVDAPARLETLACNCSRCQMLGFRHLIVGKSRFRLVSGEDALIEYRFNSGVARHLFCGTCGVQSYYIPRSNPDGFSVNARCLDPATIESEETTDFDGQNWEAHAGSLSRLSEG